MVSNMHPKSFSSSFWGAYHYSDIPLGKVKCSVSAVPSQRKVCFVAVFAFVKIGI